MTNAEKDPTLTVIFANQTEIEVSQLWLTSHSKMVQTMFSSAVGPKEVESITLSEVWDSKQFHQIKSTIEGDLSWLMDSKIQNKELGSLYLAIWRTMNYLDAGFRFNWDSLNQYTIGREPPKGSSPTTDGLFFEQATIEHPNLLRILFLLDLLLDSSDQLKEKIQSKISKLFNQANSDDIKTGRDHFIRLFQA